MKAIFQHMDDEPSGNWYEFFSDNPEVRANIFLSKNGWRMRISLPNQRIWRPLNPEDQLALFEARKNQDETVEVEIEL